MNLLYLKRREEHRIRSGHPWVFSNEVDVARSPMRAFEAGETVEVRTHADRFLATAIVNPRALVCARVIGRAPDIELDDAELRARLAGALALRERIFEGPYYRLVYGESDELPGLVVDRYGEVLCAQVTTAGMEALRPALARALTDVAGAARIVWRDDAAQRELEGLPAGAEAAGHGSESGFRVDIEENGARYRIDPAGGQKTGWFYDQRDNRRRLLRYARGARVLDLFSYTGGFGVLAAARGAREVVCVDASAAAVEQARENAAINGIEDRVETITGDAFDALKSFRDDGVKFDVVVSDPPAFIRRRKDAAAGVEAYRRLNRLAMDVLEADGILLSASCSSHLSRLELLDVLRSAGGRARRRVQVLEEGRQGPDHPVKPGFPESDYLKAFFVRVTA